MNDVFDSPTCAISVIQKEFGETYLRAFMVKVVNELLDYFSIGKTMGQAQVAQAVYLITDEYFYLKPDDFKLCFNRVKKGVYGKVYDRIDGQVIFEWLNAYNRDRALEAESLSVNEAAKYKNDPFERTSSLLDTEHHDLKMFDFKRKFKK